MTKVMEEHLWQRLRSRVGGASSVNNYYDAEMERQRLASIGTLTLSAQDLRSLKKQDPFLYYSLPGVREASVQQKRVDMHQIAQEGLRRTCASCPASIQTVATSDTTAKVKRCTRVSFECAPDLLLEDLLEEGMTELSENEKSSLALAESRLEEFLSDMGLGL
jgi:hypothetical protein